MSAATTAEHETDAEEWHALSTDRVLEKLDSGTGGLSRDETARRQETYGPNEIREGRSVSPVKLFVSQFQDVLIYVLVVAALLSLAVGFLPGEEPHYVDAGLILLILLGNGIFGFVQNYRAEQSMQRLRELSTPDATVIRDGEKRTVSATDVVPGDIVVLEQGDAVPADARLLEANSLETREAPLTGESANVSKTTDALDPETPLAERENVVYMNTNVVRGRGRAVVVETGMETEVGKIATQIQEAERDETSFQAEVDELGRRIGYGVLALIALVVVVQVLFTQAGFIPIALTAITLAVAAVPEGLPAVVTLTLALGSQKLVEKNALIRRLPVVESLGAVDVILTDKTGTLTESQMTVTQIAFGTDVYEVTGSGLETEGEFHHDGDSVDPDRLEPVLRCGALCNDAEKAPDSEDEEYHGDPTEVALLVSARKARVDTDAERVREVPFSSDRKRMTVVVEEAGEHTAYMKGAPETVLDRCDRIRIDGEVRELTAERHQEVLDRTERFAADALRVLAFASKPVSDVDADEETLETGLVFLGLQGMIDPPRAGVQRAVADCRSAGIRVVMVTGDNIETAKAIGAEIGFDPEGAMTGAEVEELRDDTDGQTNMKQGNDSVTATGAKGREEPAIAGDERPEQRLTRSSNTGGQHPQDVVRQYGELRDAVEDVEIFARVSPAHKVRVLEALQANGHRVAMTGDGVNDAPGVRNADVGIAMGMRGTDVTKEASDMVLRDDNFVTIRDAIAAGRGIFDNIRKFVNLLLSANSGEVLVVFLGVLVGSAFFPELFASRSEALILTPVMLLWINLVTDGLPALALGVDPQAPDVLEREPRSAEESVIDRRLVASVFTIGGTITLVGLALFFEALSTVESLVAAQTLLFTFFVVSEMGVIQIIRRRFGQGPFSNPWLVGAVAASLLLQLLVLRTPVADLFGVIKPDGDDWLRIGVAVGVVLVLNYVLSIAADRLFDRRNED